MQARLSSEGTTSRMRPARALLAALCLCSCAGAALAQSVPAVPEPAGASAEAAGSIDYIAMLTVFMLATFIGIGVIRRVSRLLHTPLMSLTNAISAIAVVGSIILAGESDLPWTIRLMGAVALFASMTNIISGFMITDRMLKMFKTEGGAH